jgi:hypothetical protein
VEDVNHIEEIDLLILRKAYNARKAATRQPLGRGTELRPILDILKIPAWTLLNIWLFLRGIHHQLNEGTAISTP